MNRKNLPLILMLVAGAVTCVITMVYNYSGLGRLTALLISLLVFYFLGSVMKWTLDSFDRQNEDKKKAEEEAAKEGEEGEKEESEQ